MTFNPRPMKGLTAETVKCDSCGFTAKHKAWKTDKIALASTVEKEGAKISYETGKLNIIESDGSKWALCSITSFYWIFRSLIVDPKDPCNSDFMEEIST